MFESIPREAYGSLLNRVFTGMFNQFCGYFAIKYFPLVFVSLVTNLAPLLVALFSYLLYRVGLAKLDIVILLVSFFGVTLLITGSPPSSNQDSSALSNATFKELILPSILLLCLPFNQCSIQLFLRNIRNLSEHSITAWLLVGMLVIFLPASYFTAPQGEGLFTFMGPFNLADWLLCVLFGFTGLYSQMMRAKAV